MAVASRTDLAFQQCISPACGATFSVDEVLTSCPSCGNLLDVEYDWERIRPPTSFEVFERKWMRRSDPLAYSGVWRFHELLPYAPRESVVTIGEGQTLLAASDGVGAFIGMNPGRLFLEYEGLNPSGSFKDNGMSAAFTHARMIGARRAACASTGNTSASLAVYCAVTRLMRGIIFIGSGKISYGKLSQALDYGALTIQIAGDFDDAMARVKEVAGKLGIYLVNSVNPLRIEGQKTAAFELIEALGPERPLDALAIPVGNAGNITAYWKGFTESSDQLERMPKMLGFQAAGAAPLVLGHPVEQPETLASAIRIGDPARGEEALSAVAESGGAINSVTDEQILEAYRFLADHDGVFCEPSSAASVAGLIVHGVPEGVERIVCVLTGHGLKDPETAIEVGGAIIACEPELAAVEAAVWG